MEYVPCKLGLNFVSNSNDPALNCGNVRGKRSTKMKMLRQFLFLILGYCLLPLQVTLKANNYCYLKFLLCDGQKKKRKDRNAGILPNYPTFP